MSNSASQNSHGNSGLGLNMSDMNNHHRNEPALGNAAMGNDIVPGSMARIKVVGVGGGGCNAVNRMIDSGVSGIEFWTLNTDAQALTRASNSNPLQLGQKLTRGMGAGDKPAIGQKAHEE